MVSMCPIRGNIGLVTGLRGSWPCFPAVKFFVPKLIDKGNLMGRYSETIHLSLNVSIPWWSLAKSVINGMVPSDEFLHFITCLFPREQSLPICLCKSTWTGESFYDSTGCNCYCGRWF